MTAIVLIAVERHLDGHHRQAFAIGFFAALDRPEIWLFWGPYGLWLWWKDPGARKLVIGLFVLIPVLWFLPEYWGSGHFFRGVSRAQHPRSNSPAFAKCPFCTELGDHAWPTVLLRIKVVAIARDRGGRCSAVAGESRARSELAARDARASTRSARDRARGVLGFGWWVVIAIMTQAGLLGQQPLPRARRGADRDRRRRRLGVGGARARPVGPEAARGRARRRRADRGRLRRGRGARGRSCSCSSRSWVGGQPDRPPATHRALVYQAHAAHGRDRGGRPASAAPRGCSRCGTRDDRGLPGADARVDSSACTRSRSRPRRCSAPPAAAAARPNVIFQTRAQRNAHLLPLARALADNVITGCVTRDADLQGLRALPGNLTRTDGHRSSPPPPLLPDFDVPRARRGSSAVPSWVSVGGVRRAPDGAVGVRAHALSQRAVLDGRGAVGRDLVALADARSPTCCATTARRRSTTCCCTSG